MGIIELVADRILYFVEKENLSMFAFSKKANISNSTLQNIINLRVKSVQMDTLLKIARALEINFSDFLPDEELEKIDID